MITEEQLKRICPFGLKSNITKFVPFLNGYMEAHAINTPLRKAHFIAQLAHESSQFNYVKEIASGKAYEGRKDLGNIVLGDGVKFKGRGLIQITGRSNYSDVSQWMFGNNTLIDHPQMLENELYASASAVWFWCIKNNLNLHADKDDIMSITRKINGGLNGLKERKEFLQRAKIEFK